MMFWTGRLYRRLLTAALCGSVLVLLAIAMLTPDLQSPGTLEGVAGDFTYLQQHHRTPERTILHDAAWKLAPPAEQGKLLRDRPEVRVEVWPHKQAATPRPITARERRQYDHQFECPENSDCGRVRQLLANWNTTQPKAAIYVLTQFRRLGALRNLLRSLDAHFNDRFQYPVILFHEADITASWRRVIRRQYTRSKVYFHEVSFALLPSYIPRPIRKDIPCTSHIGYRHMCRFQAKTVYELPILHGFELLWRLDDDSLLTRNVTYDVFDYMRAHNLTYGYHSMSTDNLNCVKGLWNATRHHIAAEHLQTHFFESWLQPWIYYNNFEVSRLALWTSSKYRKYINYLDRLGGIFEHRWGDAPIKSLGVSLFVPLNRTHKFSNIGYRHPAPYNDQ